ncbi:uncharacterized protein LOC119593001 [Penaeus monodon]|uniref:uncharacterized protein LOC119593001 n=1 Tax=Penaeus monodon TaxID=6687 RepID=UPI0018A7C467|nr:uncharacterized protein LOC119593001 [Penaeus monodon]
MRVCICETPRNILRELRVQTSQSQALVDFTPLPCYFSCTMEILKILLMVSLAACVTSRPLEEDAETVATEITPAPPSAPRPGQGSFLGEVMVTSEDVTVKRTPKGKKKSPKSSQEGPRASALVAAPEVSDPEAVVGIAVGTGKAFDVGVNTGYVLNDGSPGISISGATLTFNRPAQVIPVSS